MKTFLMFIIVLFSGIQFGQSSDPSPRVIYLGMEYIGGNYPAIKQDGVPTRASVFVDQVTHQEIMCFGKGDSSGLSCLITGRKR